MLMLIPAVSRAGDEAEILLELQKPGWVSEEPKEPIAEKPKSEEGS
jgi:hypothetical protein